MRLVVIGASAGGIDALAEVLFHLPGHLPAAVLIVQHLRRDRQTRLPDYLGRLSPMRVVLARQGAALEKGVAYVALPDWHMLVKDSTIVLTDSHPVHYLRPSIDVLFRSAAEECGEDVIGVVLSGTGRDGAEGCKCIKERGGVTIAQDEATAKCFGMPRAAIALGAIDYVLPVTEIAGKIISVIEQGGTYHEEDKPHA